MQPNTSWQKANSWYTGLVKDRGHYYHTHVVIPGVLNLLRLSRNASLLDLGCGPGVLGKYLPKGVRYLGIDAAPAAISAARKLDTRPDHEYIAADVSKPLSVTKAGFSHAVAILSLQNMRDPLAVLTNAAAHLGTGGRLVLVLNHPCFRIPRQSSWGVDETNKLQYRRINRYLTPLEVPLTVHPGQAGSPVTWSFHRSLSDYSRILADTGFVIDLMEEWASDKESVGKAARMENRARAEIPLFLAIRAKKN